MGIRSYFSKISDPEYGFRSSITKMTRLKARGSRIRLKLLRRKICRMYACYVSPEAIISNDIDFPHPTGIVIGRGVVVQEGCTIYQNVTLGSKTKNGRGYPILEQGCIVYAGAKVIGDLRLRKGTVVGANAVVTPSSLSGLENDILVGIPAKSLLVNGDA